LPCRELAQNTENKKINDKNNFVIIEDKI